MSALALVQWCSACLKQKDSSEFYASYRTQCKACLRAKAAPHRESKKKYLAEWRRNHPDAFRDWYSRNRERRADYWQRWYGDNKQARAASYKRWASQNTGVINALIAKRGAVKRNATPAWSDLQAVKQIYLCAAQLTKATGIQHDVDHIYPLQSPLVCGLHCESNLQILTEVENLRKGNKMPSSAS